MRIAELVATRSTCLRRQVGAVIVRDRRILATGYNGAPKGLEHCSETGCLRERLGVPPGERHEICRGIHAEQNAIIQAAYHGVSLQGATIYTTHFPCSLCIKMIINASIDTIVASRDYPDDLAKALLSESTVSVRQFEAQQAGEAGPNP